MTYELTDKALWEILVPTEGRYYDPVTEDSEVLPYSIIYHEKWDAHVRDIAGGLTVFRSAMGQWVHEKLYKERMIPVRIACTKEQMEEIAQFTLEHYNQIEVMYYKVSSEVYFAHKS